MFDYEAHKVRQPNQAGTSNVPTAAFERRSQRSAEPAQHRRVPRCRRSRSSIRLPACRSPTTRSPRSRISPIAKNLFQFFPPAQFATPDPISGVNYFGIGSTAINDDQRYVRIDHQISTRTSCLATMPSMTSAMRSSMAPIPTFPTSWPAAIRTPGFTGFTSSSPSIINESRFGYMRSVDNTLNPRTNTEFQP